MKRKKRLTILLLLLVMVALCFPILSSAIRRIANIRIAIRTSKTFKGRDDKGFTVAFSIKESQPIKIGEKIYSAKCCEGRMKNDRLVSPGVCYSWEYIYRGLRNGKIIVSVYHDGKQALMELPIRDATLYTECGDQEVWICVLEDGKLNISHGAGTRYEPNYSSGASSP